MFDLDPGNFHSLTTPRCSRITWWESMLQMYARQSGVLQMILELWKCSPLPQRWVQHTRTLHHVHDLEHVATSWTSVLRESGLCLTDLSLDRWTSFHGRSPARTPLLRGSIFELSGHRIWCTTRCKDYVLCHIPVPIHRFIKDGYFFFSLKQFTFNLLLVSKLRRA